MSLYLILKCLHILSATILFGTGIGIAFGMLVGLALLSAASGITPITISPASPSAETPPLPLPAAGSQTNEQAATARQP